jgi:hypothetical protein
VRLVEPQPAAVASALHEVLADPARRLRMARAARAWALANLDEREQFANLERVYAATTGAPAPEPARSPARVGGAPASLR